MEFLRQKLGSRKLWAAVAAAVICIVSALMGEEITPEYVEILRYAVTACVAYIFGESAVDIMRQIVAAVREKYAIPDVGELIGDPADEKTGAADEKNAESESAGEGKPGADG